MFFRLLLFRPLLVTCGFARLKTQRLHLHALRGGLEAGARLQLFTGLSLTPLAMATALQFIIPLFSTLLAFAVLHEETRHRRVSELILSFAGTVIILRPDVGGVALLSIFFVTSRQPGPRPSSSSSACLAPNRASPSPSTEPILCCLSPW